MFIIFDLEATCWGSREESQNNTSEIIQIGAIKIDLKESRVHSVFDSLIRPKLSKPLSEYCTKLTGLKSKDVYRAEYFEQVYPKFVEFCGSKYNNTLVAWGAYDARMINEACIRESLEYKLPGHYINASLLFKEYKGLKKKTGLEKALESLGYKFIGQPHDGLADALNTARIFTHMLGVELNVSEFET